MSNLSIEEIQKQLREINASYESKDPKELFSKESAVHAAAADIIAFERARYYSGQSNSPFSAEIKQIISRHKERILESETN